MRHPLSTYQLLVQAAQMRPDAEALVSGRISLSYRELLAIVDRIASAMSFLGVRRGARVVVSMSKSISEVAVMLAASRLRGIVVNVTTQWSAGELVRICRATEALMLCIDRTRRSQLPELSSLPGLCVLDYHGGEKDADSADWYRGGGLLERHVGAIDGSAGDRPSVDDSSPLDRDAAFIIYTSGSTRKPKGVVHTNSSLLASIRSTVEFLSNVPSDRVLCALPFCFTYGLGQLVSMLCVAGTSVLHLPSTTRELVRSVVDHRITGFGTIPPVWREIAAHLDAVPTSFPHLRYITAAGGKCSGSLLDSLKKHFCTQKKHIMYGSTEAIRSTYLDPDLFEVRAGSIGSAVPNAQVYVVNPDGTRCENNVPGELVHCGPSLALGYWNDPTETTARFRPCPAADLDGNRAFFSGDLVLRDEHGLLWYLGRLDRMIKSSGFRINPLEIEAELIAIGGVRDAVVFGQADESRGEAIHAVVQLTPDAPCTEPEMRRHCLKSLPAYMVPAVFHFWSGEFPQTGNTKVDIPAVIATIRAGLADVRARGSELRLVAD